MAAIYQWLINEQVLTTTIYPVEMQEQLVMSISFNENSGMDELLQDFMEGSMQFLDMTVTQLLLTGPQLEDEMQGSMSFLNMTVTVLLLTGPQHEDAVMGSMEFLDMTVENKLVTAYSPDQNLELSILLDEPECSMDAA